MEALTDGATAPTMTTEEVSAALGISNDATVKNWLHGGFFPGAEQDVDGVWRFCAQTVEQVTLSMQAIRHANSIPGVTADDFDRGDAEPECIA